MNSSNIHAALWLLPTPVSPDPRGAAGLIEVVRCLKWEQRDKNTLLDLYKLFYFFEILKRSNIKQHEKFKLFSDASQRRDWWPWRALLRIIWIVLRRHLMEMCFLNSVWLWWSSPSDFSSSFHWMLSDS